MKSDVIIIGSGLGGLICAKLLAERGKRVTVLERHAVPGGCLQSYRRRGVSFDTGLHYVGGLAEGQRLHGIFERLGLMRLPWQRMDPQGFDLITIGGETFPFVEGYRNFADTLSDRFPHEREALYKYVELMERADRLPLGDPEVQTLCAINACDYLHETFHDELLINVLAGNALKTELRRESLPLFHFLHATSTFIGGGAWRLQGCGDDIVQLLVDDIKAHGGQVITGAQVEELIETDGLITAARCTQAGNGHAGKRAPLETYEGDIFISDIHPQQTFALVKESKKLSRLFRRRIDMLENTCGMFTVSLVTHGIPYFNHNKYIYRRANVWEVVGEASKLCSSTVVGEASKLCSSTVVGEASKLCGSTVVGEASKLCSSTVVGEASKLCSNFSIDRVMVSCMAKPPLRGEVGGGLVIDLLTPVPLSLFDSWNDSRVGRRPDDYRQLKKQLADECIALAASVMPELQSLEASPTTAQSLEASPTIAQSLEASPTIFTSTPLTWRDYTLTPLGSAFGLRKDSRQPLLTILSPRTPIPNLLLTGQNLMLHGLEGVTMTALQTCAKV